MPPHAGLQARKFGFVSQNQNLASLTLLIQPHAKSALRFGDKADPLSFEGNFERSLFIWIVLTAEVCGDGGPVLRRSRR
jgi:hypothetical protein